MKQSLFRQIGFKLIPLLLLLLWQPISYAEIAYVRVNVSTDNMSNSTKRVQALCSLNDTRSTIESKASVAINNGRFMGNIDVPFNITKPINQYGSVQCQIRLCSSEAVCEIPVKGSSVANASKAFNAYDENASHQLSGIENIEIATSSQSSPTILPNRGNTTPFVIPNRNSTIPAKISGPVGVTSNRLGTGTLTIPATIKNTSITKSETLVTTHIGKNFTYRGPVSSQTGTGSNDTISTGLSVPQLTELKVISAASNAHLFYDDPRASLPEPP